MFADATDEPEGSSGASSVLNGPGSQPSVQPCSAQYQHDYEHENTRKAYRGLGVVELVDERAEAEAVAEEDELVLVLGTLLACAREVLDRTRPLVVHRPRLAREGVQVVHERREELEGTLIRAQLRVQLINMVRDRVLGALL